MTEPNLDDIQTIEYLRQANSRLSKQLDAERVSKQELVDAIHQAARDVASGFDFKALPSPVFKPANSNVPETAICVLSDWQLGKVTPSYNSQVCEERMELYGDRVERLIGLARKDHPVETLRAYLLGDLIEGELIFPGQAHRVDSSIFRQVMVDGPRILSAFLRRMAGIVPHVGVVGVIGNHGAFGGRARRDMHPETNGDAMMYEATRIYMEQDKRVTWGANMTPGERHWYAIDTIGEKNYFLFHGDQVKGGFGGFPWYGFAKKVLGWRNGVVHDSFDYAFAGHFHTPTRMTIGPVTLWVSGSTESHNTYAAEMLAAQGSPSQWLLFAHPEKGITAEYEVKLT